MLLHVPRNNGAQSAPFRRLPPPADSRHKAHSNSNRALERRFPLPPSRWPRPRSLKTDPFSAEKKQGRSNLENITHPLAVAHRRSCGIGLFLDRIVTPRRAFFARRQNSPRRTFARLKPHSTITEKDPGYRRVLARPMRPPSGMRSFIRTLCDAQDTILRQAPGSRTHRSALQSLKAKIPAQLLAHYLRLIERNQRGVSMVRHGVCSECHIRVPFGMSAALRTDSLQVCEQCGCYLLLADEEFDLRPAAPVASVTRRGRTPQPALATHA